MPPNKSDGPRRGQRHREDTPLDTAGRGHRAVHPIRSFEYEDNSSLEPPDKGLQDVFTFMSKNLSPWRG